MSEAGAGAPPGDEARRLEEVYERYAADPHTQSQWDASHPGNRAMVAERLRATQTLLARRGLWPPRDYKILDVGCGTGDELARFLDHGALASDLVGVDLLRARIDEARRAHPTITFTHGDASSLDLPDASFRLVLSFTVFSSVLEERMTRAIASEIDRVLEPGGCVLWYDVRRDNPRNPNTRPFESGQIESLFPDYDRELQSITVAPPLARRLGPLTGVLYPVLGRMPALRSHYLGTLRKPDR